MNGYEVEYIPQARADFNALDNSQQTQVDKAIGRVAKNPLPKNEGGYGNPLGHVYGLNLTGLCSIKLRKLGIRVIYKVVREGNIMRIIVIAARKDEEVFRIADQREARN
jgi:mRNA interferase RelE/StbE